jgi:beta-lactamase regulating signal transducer with metallopeptidase domain
VIGLESWGLALVHFLWQGFLAALVLSMVLRSLSGARPEARYAVSVTFLFLMATLPVVTLVGLEARGVAEAANVGENLVRPGSGIEIEVPAPPSADLGPAVVESPAPPGGSAVSARSVAAVGSALAGRFWTALRPLLPWIVGAWALGVLALSVRLLGGWVRLRRLTTTDVLVVPESVWETARDLCERLAVRPPVRLVRSARVAVPAVVGWIRPVILLPVSALTGLTPSQLEAVLAHELAHVRRHDYLVNLVQTVIETLLFYHPAVWWVSRRIREERERCCDDLAVAVCGDRRLYATALLELETLRAPTPSPALGADGTSLVPRVRRLFGPQGAHGETLPRWSAAFATVAIATAMAVACVGGSLATPPGLAIATPGGGPGPGSAMVFLGEAFANRVYRYEVTEGGGAALSREITANVNQPGGIAFSPWGEMFVSNRAGSVARFLDPEGDATPHGLITAESTGAPFAQPHWLTFRNGEMFLAQESGTVLRFAFDSAGDAFFNGTLVAGEGSRGIQTNPVTGEVMVSNLENAVHRFAFDDAGKGSSNGLIRGGGMNHGHGMAFTPWGELLVANYWGDSVSRFVFDAEGNAVPNGVIAGRGMAGPIDLDFSPWGELFVTNHNQIPGTVTRWRFSADDATADAVYAGSFQVPGNLGGIRFARRKDQVRRVAAPPVLPGARQ